MKEEIERLLKEVERDEYACYKDAWERDAVAVLNEYNIEERGDYDAEIWDTASDEWDEFVRGQLESRAWQGLMFFLGKLEPSDDWAQLDGYGNATPISGADLVGLLKDAREEMERED